MTDYLKFFIPVGVVGLACLGFVLGGYWVWLGFATFPALAAIDMLLPRNLGTRRMTPGFWATVPVWLSALGSLAIYLIAAWRLAQGDLTGLQIAGSIASLTWISVVPGGPAAHELWHMRNPLSRELGRISQICMFDGIRDIGHVVGHHIDVCTPKDGDTAPRGQTMYAFAMNELYVSTKICLDLESASLRRKGYSPWNWRNRLWLFALVQLLFQSIVLAIGGWVAVVVALTSMVLARIWIEGLNYFQHYGLIRVEGTPIGYRHVWNHLSELSRVMSFEITNHAGHHQDSYVPYHGLKPHQDAIPMPSLFTCFFVSLIPPLWHERIVKPALKKWDLEYATPAERALAREQNRQAGWPDWVGDAGDEAGKAATVGC